MVLDGLKDALVAEIEEAKGCYTESPPNEASTCDWVILPLLRAAGYSRKDIVSQAGNPGGGYPDYTILPNTPHTWYLEAKGWKNSLENGPEATQALNYANAHGQRWVVLSNGKEWLLFDNHIQGVQADKRVVARSEIGDPGFIDFIMAVSKPSVQSGGLEEYAATWRLRAVLRQQLLSKDSQIVKAVLKVLKVETGLSSIQASDVVRYFGEVIGSPMVVDGGGSALTRAIQPTHDTPSGNNLQELLELGSQVWNNKPIELGLPDGASLAVSSWIGVASGIVSWVGVASGLPELPFRGCKGGKRWFLSLSPVHEDEKPMHYRLLQITGREVYMDVNRSSSSFAKCLYSLCEAAGVQPTGFHVRLRTPVTDPDPE
jgi:hypothetical protein